MKRIIVLALALLIVFSLVSCTQGGKKETGLSGSVSIKEWLEAEGKGDDFTVTVKLVELLNPYYGRVEDESGSVLLFGLWENGEPRAFAEKEINIGDTIVIKNPVYNIYEGNVEMKEGTLVEKK